MYSKVYELRFLSIDKEWDKNEGEIPSNGVVP